MKALNPNLRCNFYSPATFYFSLLRLLFHSALRLPPMKIRWKHWWPIFATGDNSMLVTIQYWWQFRCWWQFQYWWQFNIGDNSILVTIQYWWPYFLFSICSPRPVSGCLLGHCILWVADSNFVECDQKVKMWQSSPTWALAVWPTVTFSLKM